VDRTQPDPMIRLEGVSKRYADGTVAVHELDLDVPEGDTVVLVGPSGCGKSTTLKMVNRLIEPTSGRIVLDGEDVTDVDPVRLRRRIGYVIQQVGLFPHQTVRANVATVPQLVGWDRKRVTTRVDELLELVGLDPARYGGRYPHQLSGGQRQRVGVARALAADPPVLLMDEPFGAVDPIVRDRLQMEFIRLQKELRKTVLFVTHDIEEAVRIADRIAVFREGGHLEQYATPAEILADPATEFVADFVGSDRSVKRLSVTPLTRDDLEPAAAVAASGPTVALPSSLRDALSVVLSDPAAAVAVVDEAGATLGSISADGIRRALHRHDPVPAAAAAAAED
jgi:osmoprotectant transport system ATP-binding protein